MSNFKGLFNSLLNVIYIVWRCYSASQSDLLGFFSHLAIFYDDLNNVLSRLFFKKRLLKINQIRNHLTVSINVVKFQHLNKIHG